MDSSVGFDGLRSTRQSVLKAGGMVAAVAVLLVACNEWGMAASGDGSLALALGALALVLVSTTDD